MPRRINKAIELLEMGQPVYMTHPEELSYDCGRAMSKTWADVIHMDFEHHFFDIGGLTNFMKGLKDGGPTPSGHLTPTVLTTLPSNCITVEEVRANAWQMRHVLSTGAHGILHTHARDPEAVKWFVAACRYPYQALGRNELPEGIRGSGGQAQPAAIWGVDTHTYTDLADPWPLNPKGELLLGLKIEDRHCLPNVDRTAAVPGIGFAEWGPGDMGMSFGEPDAHDPPYPEFMDDARNTVKNALDKNGVAFYSGWNDTSMTEEQRVKFIIEKLGSKLIGAPTREVADIGRKLTGRKMPV
jgi:4-hydroxy-2-oxoheptanedioate aldolase